MTANKLGTPREVRVLAVTQYYPPEKVRLVPSLVSELNRRGVRTQVLTGYPNYPGGVLFDGYKQRFLLRESHSGVPVTRVPLYVDHSERLPHRMLNYISFGVSSALLGHHLAASADVVYVYATQMTASLGPWFWNLLRSTRYVLHIQDLWPDSITGSSIARSGGVAQLAEQVLNPWIASVYERASKIIVIAPTMKRILVERGVDPRKIEVIYNWAEEGLPQVSHSKRDLGKPVELIYAGNLGEMQNLHHLVRAASQFRSSELILTLIGEGNRKNELVQLARDLDASNVKFLPAVSPEEIAGVYEGKHAAVVTLKDLPVFRGTIPSKLQAALARGLPVVTAVSGDVTNIVSEYGAGVCAAPGSTEAMVRAFRTLVNQSSDSYREMLRGAKRLFDERFRKEIAVGQIERVLTESARGDRDV